MLRGTNIGKGLMDQEKIKLMINVTIIRNVMKRGSLYERTFGFILKKRNLISVNIVRNVLRMRVH